MTVEFATTLSRSTITPTVCPDDQFIDLILQPELTASRPLIIQHRANLEVQKLYDQVRVHDEAWREPCIPLGKRHWQVEIVNGASYIEARVNVSQVALIKCRFKEDL